MHLAIGMRRGERDNEYKHIMHLENFNLIFVQTVSLTRVVGCKVLVEMKHTYSS